MGHLMIINGSPRAPHSNSKRYAKLFQKIWGQPAEEYAIMENKPDWQKIQKAAHLLLVIPLYADSLPVQLLQFLKDLTHHLPQTRPTMHVLINCGFLEPEQNSIAVEIIQFYCKENQIPYGMTLCIGAGEAILNTPFRFLVKRKLKAFAHGIQKGRHKQLNVTMPLTKNQFIRASTQYWIQYGQKNKITKEQMETMKIEGK